MIELSINRILGRRSVVLATAFFIFITRLAGPWTGKCMVAQE